LETIPLISMTLASFNIHGPFKISNGIWLNDNIKGIVSKISILRQNGQSGTETEEIT
jgi:hypothetical protein